MKLNLSIFTGVASLAALMSGVFADTATTDPVGYITSSLAPDNVGTGADTVVAPSLVQANAFSGVSTNDPSGTDTIQFASGVPVIAAVDAGLYYLEIKTGTQAGWWASLKSNTATTATSVQLSENFPAGLAIGVSVNIRKHNTLGTWMGANTPGLRTIDESITKPDRVLILNPQSQVTSQYVYGTAFYGAPGFYNEVTEELADNAIIYPGSAVVIRRFTAGVKNIVHVAHVKTTPTQVDIFKGDNYVEANLATGTTLLASGLDTGNLLTGLVREDYNNGNGQPDRLLILSPTQITAQYVALAGGATAFINEVTEIDANGQALPEGNGFLIRRDTTLAPGIWTAPAQVIAP